MRYRWFAKDREDEDEFGIPMRSMPEEEPEEEPKKKLFSHSELSILVVTFLVMLYGISEYDIPVLFFTISVLLFLLRRLTVLMQSPHADTINNLLKGFSIALFFGAIFLAFA